MTIIAVRNSTMSCDSCWATEGMVDVLANKLLRLPSGGILGQAGDNDARGVVKLLSTVKTGRQMPTRNELMATREDSLMLLLLPNGEIWKISTSNNLPEHIQDEDIGVWKIAGFPYACVGSGQEIGMGAFAHGATSQQAVSAAIKHQVNCRGPIYSLSLLKKKKHI